MIRCRILDRRVYWASFSTVSNIFASCSRANYPHAVALDFGHHRGQSVLCPGAMLAPACFLSAASKSVFPVKPPVKKAARTHLDRIKIVEAAGVDAKILWIGAGNVEGMDAAMAAEGMLRDAGIEAIGGEIVTAAQQLELPGRGANVKDALLSADRAVAFAHGRLLQVDADAEPHRPQWQPPSYVCSISLLPCRSTLFRLSFWGSSAHNP